MTKDEAVNVIRGIIREDQWGSFTSWAESLEEESEEYCEHGDDSYVSWLEANGSSNPEGDSERLYEAMEVYAGTGPCACAAGQGLFSYPQPTT